MKKFFTFLIIMIGLLAVLSYRDKILTFIIEEVLYKQEVIIAEPNAYSRSYKFNYINETNDFFISSQKDFLNVFYTFLNGGSNQIVFYCEDNYIECNSDIKSFDSDNVSLSYINNFVHPFNSYKNILIYVDEYGKITVTTTKLYEDSEIAMINAEIDRIYDLLITNNMSTRDKISIIHDYIINNTKYDYEYVNSNSTININSSNKSTGVLFNHLGICGGYTDTMALFLNKMGVINYKISNEEHIWNLIYLDGNWYHLDLTWDDPITSNGTNILLHDYFLIDSTSLNKKNESSHNYQQEIYSEASY